MTTQASPSGCHLSLIIYRTNRIITGSRAAAGDTAKQHAVNRSIAAHHTLAAMPGVQFASDTTIVIVLHPGFELLDVVGPFHFLAGTGATVHLATTGNTLDPDPSGARTPDTSQAFAPIRSPWQRPGSSTDAAQPHTGPSGICSPDTAPSTSTSASSRTATASPLPASPRAWISASA